MPSIRVFFFGSATVCLQFAGFCLYVVHKTPGFKGVIALDGLLGSLALRCPAPRETASGATTWLQAPSTATTCDLTSLFSGSNELSFRSAAKEFRAQFFHVDMEPEGVTFLGPVAHRD